MSMISMQVDRLRDRAMRVEVFLEGSTDAIPTDTHEQLRDAADTILELRDDLQQANDAVQDAEHDESMAWDRVRKAEAENAKLRELITDVHEALRADKAGMFHKLILASMEDDMQKLGIEEEPHD